MAPSVSAAAASAGLEVARRERLEIPGDARRLAAAGLGGYQRAGNPQALGGELLWLAEAHDRDRASLGVGDRQAS